MNWFATQRQLWVDEVLAVFGFINRQHLVRKFGVSVPQASKDLAAYQRTHRHKIRYDKTRRAYVLNGR